jgi:recombination protein RecT
MNMPALPHAVAQLAQYNKAFDLQNKFGMDFANECLFAKQQLLKNDYTLKCAENQPESLKSAILNVAAIGISLNPASGHCYLVPRSPAQGKPPQICLDISFKGLVKLATDSGAIRWAKAELVYQGDEFHWVNMNTVPHHNPLDPFADHTTLDGLRGGYCVAQLADGSYLVDRMGAADILKVADTSMAKKGPWKTWPAEMAKKTIVKRAAKSWPQSASQARMDEAIAVLNAHEGLELIEEPQTRALPESIASENLSAEQCADLLKAISVSSLTEDAFCKNAGIATISALAVNRLNGAKTYLEGKAR